MAVWTVYAIELVLIARPFPHQVDNIDTGGYNNLVFLMGRSSGSSACQWWQATSFHQLYEFLDPCLLRLRGSSYFGTARYCSAEGSCGLFVV
jgi:hypothetical protein